MAVVKSDLKRFLDAKKTQYRLIGDVERHLLSRPVGDRRTDVLHPSEIIKKDWCRRASYFLLKGHTKIQTKPSLRLQSIFDEGHAIHAKWQNWFYEMGVLHGNFKCQVCGEVNWGTSPKLCGVCGNSSLIYTEVSLVDNALRIAGHTDGWIKGIGEDCLIEIKSIGPGTIRTEAPDLFEPSSDFMNAWKNVRRPFRSHLLQGQMYLELMKRMGHEINEIVFIYELKADQDYKEFVVRADYELVKHIFDNAKKVVQAVESNVAPPCNNNVGGTCPQCEGYKETE
jgi:CRISPR/Cas system-associated exonuclease Cas4 (RecB family)